MQLIKPMLAKPAMIPDNDAAYSFEIKWDGIRAIIYIENGDLTIRSRNLIDITHQYPELQHLSRYCNNQRLILDGEIVAFASDSRPSFKLLQQRMNLTSAKTIHTIMQTIPATYIIFDLLQYESRSLLDLPYTERRSQLEALQLAGSSWQTPAYTIGQGNAILQATRILGLEGIIAKKLDSRYYPGKRSNDWFKIKNTNRQELVIGGWIPGKGNRRGQIGALIVGYYNSTPELAPSQKLIYAGKVGTGFNSNTLNQLAECMTPLVRNTSPFTDQAPSAAIFVEPKLVGEVEFTEWTSNNTLRHPSFKGLRNDKDPRYVVRES